MTYYISFLFLLLLFLPAKPTTIKNDTPLFLKPIKKQDFKYISSPFGWRIHPISGKIQFHQGIDIASNNKFTCIYATADGFVSELGTSKKSARYIRIQHNKVYSTKYLHLSKIFVRKGEQLIAGQVIALMGNTGWSTGTHLHYEITRNGIPINPLIKHRLNLYPAN